MISQSVVVVHLCQRETDQSSQISILISHSVCLFTCQQATTAWAWKLVGVTLWNNRILHLPPPPPCPFTRLSFSTRLSLHIFSVAVILQSVHDLSLYDCPPLSPPGTAMALRCSASRPTAPGRWWRPRARWEPCHSQDYMTSTLSNNTTCTCSHHNTHTHTCRLDCAVSQVLMVPCTDLDCEDKHASPTSSSGIPVHSPLLQSPLPLSLAPSLFYSSLLQAFLFPAKILLIA